MQQKVKIGYSLHLAENRKTKNKISFHKILSFLCQECCPLKSFLSLLISICLLAFSPQCLRPANPQKAYQPTQHSTTNQKWKERSNSIVTAGRHRLSSSRTNCQKVMVTSPCSKAQKKNPNKILQYT
jgi:hypothetical protein